MEIFFQVIAIFLIISGIFYLYEGVRYRSKAGFKVGKIMIPLWIMKLLAAIFILALGVYALLIYT